MAGERAFREHFVHRTPGSDWCITLVESVGDGDSQHGFYITRGIISARQPVKGQVRWGCESGPAAFDAALRGDGE